MKTSTQSLKRFFATLFIATSMVFGWAISSLAQFEFDGNKFQSNCVSVLKTDKEGVEWHQSALCMGFVQGVINGLTSTGQISICFSQGVSVCQTIQVVLKYMGDHPEQLHFPADQIIKAAMEKAFPCKGE